MNSKVAIKFAVSALALGTTMVACKPAAESRIASVSAKPAKAERQAADFFASAQTAVQKGDLAGAITPAEKAVELSPRDVGYRMLLADLYLKTGRFQSAETTFGDVLRLSPSNLRASLSVALSRIALGQPERAVQVLDSVVDAAPAADIGLAYALAGQPRRAIELLEPAARAPGATGRVRQNLALAYAFAGDWPKARATAEQDISPAELAPRLQQWAAMTQTSAPQARIAGLLGVTAVEDPGQPVRLALADPAPQPTALAAVEPAPAPVAAVPEPAPQPVRTAAAAAELPQWVSERAAAEAASAPAERVAEVETKPVYADAVQALVTPQPAVIRAAPARALPAALTHFERPAPRTRTAAAPRTGSGRFAVQLGAFNSAAAVERAWAQAYRRYGFGSHTPLSTTVKIAGRGTFHRLSVAGFASHDEAARVCSSVRAKGGACFVRAVAGDAPVLWASRYLSRRGG